MRAFFVPTAERWLIGRHEPQRASDVFSMWQSLIADYQVVDRSFLVKDVPEDRWYDYDYLIGMLDWDANVDPEFAKNRLFHPTPVREEGVMREDGYSEKWVVYSTGHYSAKELTISPKRSVTIKDAAAYGLIVVQGWGSIGKLEVETPSLIRFGEMTKDELFVTADAARNGVVVTNRSDTENLVMLKHFGPGNPDAEALVRRI